MNTRGPAYLSATPAARFFFRRMLPVILLFLPLFVLYVSGGINNGAGQNTAAPLPTRPGAAINVTAAMVANSGSPPPPQATATVANPNTAAIGPVNTSPVGVAAISDDAVNAISRGLYCPVCQNISLEVCPTDACARWREQVRDLLAEGKTETEIRQYFIDRFGMRTVGTPTDTAGQLIAVGLPFALFALVGGYLAFRLLLFRSRRGGPESPFAAVGIDDVPPPPPPTPNAEQGYGDEVVASVDYAARIEQELKDQP